MQLRSEDQPLFHGRSLPSCKKRVPFQFECQHALQGGKMDTREAKERIPSPGAEQEAALWDSGNSSMRNHHFSSSYEQASPLSHRRRTQWPNSGGKRIMAISVYGKCKKKVVLNIRAERRKDLPALTLTAPKLLVFKFRSYRIAANFVALIPTESGREKFHACNFNTSKSHKKGKP